MKDKKHMSENFRLITPVNTVINTFLLGCVLFFLTQQYYRVDRIEEKTNIQGQDIQRIKGYLRISEASYAPHTCSFKNPIG